MAQRTIRSNILLTLDTITAKVSPINRTTNLQTLETNTAKVNVMNSTYLVFRLHQIAKDPEIADFAKDTRNEFQTFTVGLHICLSLDRDGKSRTPLEPT